MQETILIIGGNEDGELQNNVERLSILLPEHLIQSIDIDMYEKEIAQGKGDYVAAIINMHNVSHAQAMKAIGLLQNIDLKLPIIIWIHYGEEAFARDALKAGAHDFLVKPVASEKVVLSLKHACDVRRMRYYIARLEQHIAEQTDISPHERQAIMINQMNSFLVDENGKIKPLKLIEKEAIAVALRYTNGCVSHAAQHLGIGRSTLYRKVSEYNIESRSA